MARKDSFILVDTSITDIIRLLEGLQSKFADIKEGAEEALQNKDYDTQEAKTIIGMADEAQEAWQHLIDLMRDMQEEAK